MDMQEFGSSFAGQLTILIGIVTMIVFWCKGKPWRIEDYKVQEKQEEEIYVDEPVYELPTIEIADEDMPPGGIFTLESLRPFDGSEKPLCMGICGKVFNVSSSTSIRPGAGYGKLWGGNDATYSLATGSLRPADANMLDFELSDLNAGQLGSLASWYCNFVEKYPIVGVLQEYEAWDFSSVEKEANIQKPFGSSPATPEPPTPQILEPKPDGTHSEPVAA